MINRVPSFKYETSAAPYRWVISRDHLYELSFSELRFESFRTQTLGKPMIGTEGPRNLNSNIKMTSLWRCYDDDDTLYYEGIIGGDYTGFEPLDDFCQPDSGCTRIDYWNPITNEWETL